MTDRPHIDAPSAGDVLRVTIHDVTVEGAGVGRTPDGFVLFVPGALPGDEVEARVERVRRAHGEAAIVRTLRASGDRRDAPCPVQQRCGGCALMPLDEAAQLELKARHLVETLRRVGGLELEPDALIASPSSLGYRNRVRFAIAARGDRPLVGFRPRGRGDGHVAVRRCLLVPDEATAIAERWMERLDECSRDDAPWPSDLSVRGSHATGEFLVVMHGRAGAWPEAAQAARAFLEDEPRVVGVVRVIEERGRVRGRHVLAGVGEVVERIGRFDVPLDATSFQQVNPAAAERLYDEVAAALRGPGPPSRILDLFCGAGLAGLEAARDEAELVGVESEPRSVALAERLAETLGARARFFLGDAVRVAREMASAGERFDALIANPPRRGAGAELGVHSRALGVRSAVLVSCHAATLARDAAGFREAGYRPTRLVAVDLFPQTPHLEAVLGWELG